MNLPLGMTLITAEQFAASRHLYEMFPVMQEIIPECSRGDVEFIHVDPSIQEAYVVGRLRNELRTPDPMVQMNIGGVGWMFDTLHEKWMNRTAVMCARGDVLIGGLGMGMILWPILRKADVRSVTVIENSPDVIALVLPTLRSALGFEKLKVVLADARSWEPEAGEAFDYIWLDCIPAYGYGKNFLDIHSGWLQRYSKFHRTGGGLFEDVDHWGYQENLLWCLHGRSEPEDWPEEDRRVYPIGPPDPAVALLEADIDYDLAGAKALGMTREELVRAWCVDASA